jgi:hypothetical protein
LDALIRFLKNFLEQLADEHYGHDRDDQHHQRGHDKRKFCAQPQLHGLHSVSARSP